MNNPRIRLKKKCFKSVGTLQKTVSVELSQKFLKFEEFSLNWNKIFQEMVLSKLFMLRNFLFLCFLKLRLFRLWKTKRIFLKNKILDNFLKMRVFLLFKDSN